MLLLHKGQFTQYLGLQFYIFKMLWYKYNMLMKYLNNLLNDPT